MLTAKRVNPISRVTPLTQKRATRPLMPVTFTYPAPTIHHPPPVDPSDPLIFASAKRPPVQSASQNIQLQATAPP